MGDIILFIAVIAFMAGGYFAVRKIGELFDKNYRGFDCDDGESEETMLQKEEEDTDYTLRKKQ